MIQTLRGFQNSNPEFKQPGIVITQKGGSYNILNLQPADVTIMKIANSLSREARYVGNTEKPYYVAQHVVMGAEAFLLCGRPDFAKIYMLHDGSESILRDITKPVKNLLPDYVKLEEEVEKFIAGVYNIPFPYPPEIKILDANSAQYEMTFMMHTHLHTDYWTSEQAYNRFLEMWDKIEYLLGTYYNQQEE